jgi:5'-nucleotidase/UDP-sugar diphosphatase
MFPRVRFRSLASTLAALFLCALLIGQDKAPQEKPDVVFLHWNDFHGQVLPREATWRGRGRNDQPLPMVGGAAALAGFVAKVRASAGTARVIVTDGGDWYQGTLEGNETRGRLVVALMNRLLPDAAVLGNHEYDFGDANVKELVALAKFPVLGANILDGKSKERTLMPYVRPFVTLQVKGVRIAIVGLITEGTRLVSTGPWGDAVFEEEKQTLTTLLPEVRKVADVVVLLTHCGVETDKELARAFPEIPLILGGHSHTGLEKALKVGATWIVQTHGKCSEVYRVDGRLDPEQKKLTLLDSRMVELDLAEHPEDADTKAFVAEQTKAIAATWDEPVSELLADLRTDRGPNSSAAGNLVADMMRQAGGADLAFTNKGGLRTTLRKGPLTPRMVYELLPFENTAVTMTMTGKQVRSLLTTCLDREHRPLEISGGSYRYTFLKDEGARRLLEVTVGGKPLTDDQDYRVTTNSFLAAGGDGYPHFKEGTDRKDSGALLRDLMLAQVRTQKQIAVDAGNRIVFVPPEEVRK